MTDYLGESIDLAVDQKRRKFLTAATTACGAIGVGFTAVPFLSYWQPDARTVAAGAPIEVDITGMRDGQLIIVAWRGKPVWIVKRPESVLAELSEKSARLRDPASEDSVQPLHSRNAYRAVNPRYFVAVGVCTHLGCSPVYRPEIAPDDLGADWPGGFFCPCHGSKFDLSGRVYVNVPAPLNLEIPPYHYVNNTVIRIGENEEGTDEEEA